jgi:hypothetical protein
MVFYSGKNISKDIYFLVFCDYMNNQLPKSKINSLPFWAACELQLHNALALSTVLSEPAPGL